MLCRNCDREELENVEENKPEDLKVSADGEQEVLQVPEQFPCSLWRR